MNRKLKEIGWYLLFTFPLLFIFITVVIIPFFIGIIYSFFSWDGLPLNPKIFIGIENYKMLFHDEGFMKSAGNTIVFTLLAVVIINVVGFVFSLIVTSELKSRNIVRAMLFMPYLIGGLILGYIWNFILSDGISTIGEITGWNKVFFNWLLDPKMTLISMVIVTTWQMAGYLMIIYITGIMTIPDDIIEAASVDGAGFLKTLFYIKFPLLMPSITIGLFLTLSNCLKIFDVNLSLTGGGPNKATEMFAMNIYNEIFAQSHFGYGQAKAILFFVAVTCVTLFQVSITKKREVEL